MYVVPAEALAEMVRTHPEYVSAEPAETSAALLVCAPYLSALLEFLARFGAHMAEQHGAPVGAWSEGSWLRTGMGEPSMVFPAVLVAE
ncbi:hypothetical protein [Nocardia sp. NPDC051750]|uniref:hypothetical protein n=1 Tax=Nocardia sp. NPDC051750 TaxID=3364325 RepID=UPI00378D9BFA